jgi:hypothetical protein
MRRLCIVLAAAATVFVGGPAAAVTTTAPAQVRAAAENIKSIETVACWRYGWRGWGVYPCAYGPAYSPYYYGPRPYYYPYYYYRWRRWW